MKIFFFAEFDYKYLTSIYLFTVTEEEVVEGLIKDPDPDSHCLCFIRNLRDINLKHPRAWRFIDQEDDGEVLIKQLLLNTRVEIMYIQDD